MSEYVVIWDGTMGSLTNSDGWVTRGSYLLDAAPGTGGFPSVHDAARSTAPAGKIWRPQPKRHVRQGAIPLGPHGACRQCDGRIKPAEVKRRYRLCRPCRGLTANGKRRAA